MAHGLRRYARHVQNVLTEKLSQKPPYTWCLQMVQRYWAEVEGLPSQERKDKLAKRILAIGALHLQVEGRFRFPSKSWSGPA